MPLKKLVCLLMAFVLAFGAVPVEATEIKDDELQQALYLIPEGTPEIDFFGADTTAPKTVTVEEAETKLQNFIEKFEGKFFTVSGNYCPASGIHATACSNCLMSNVIAAEWVEELVGMGTLNASLCPTQYSYKGTQGSADGYQCFGFANFAHWYIFAGKNTDKVTSTLELTGPMTYETIIKALPGDVIRSNYYGGHSMIFIDCDEEGFTVLDSNHTGNADGKSACIVKVHKVKYNAKYTVAITGVENYGRKSATEHFLVKYNANGGTNAPKTQIKTEDVNLVLTSDIPTFEGREFLGWARTADAEIPEFVPGAEYSENADITLYAVWSECKHSYEDGTCIHCGEEEPIIPEGWKDVPFSVNEKSGHLAYKIEDGVLTFRDFGNSSMEDYGKLPDYSNMSRENPTDYTIAEWYQRRKEITKVVFDETISYIGSYVLTNMDAVAEIRIENPEAEVVRNAVLFSTTARETPLNIFAASTVKTVDYWIRGNGNRKISAAISEATLYYTDLENYAEMLNECEKNLISAEQISIEMLCEAVELISKIPQNNYSVSDYKSTVYGAESAVVLLRKISSGTCGEGVFYNLEVSENTRMLKLNITGTGSMNSYETENDVPWHEIMDSIGEVAIGEEISGFDAKAFPEDTVYKLYLNSEAFEFAKENGFDIKIEKLRILCIGNSHTSDYSEFIRNVLADVENAGLETEITVTRAIIGSIGLYSGRNSNPNATYRSHFEAINNKTGAYNYLAKNRYDLIIVQDYMESVVDSPEVFKAGIASFIGKAKEIASGNGKGEPQVAWFADWVDIRSTGGDTALRDGEGNKISLEVLNREEVYAKSLANISAVEKAIAENAADMPDFVIHGSTFKQNAMSSYFGTTKIFDKRDFCILERDTTHLTYELGRYLFAAGVVSEILNNYSEILITERGKIDVGTALSIENGPSAEGEESQYSGAVNEDILAVIREVIESPDEFRQSIYTVDPVEAFMEKVSGIEWNLAGAFGEEAILEAIEEQIDSICENEIESFGLSMTEYESENDYTFVLRASHGYSIIEKKFTVHNHVYDSVITEPTCTEHGYTTYTCTICGDSYIGNYVEATGHSYENGICTVCGEWEYPIADLNLDGFVTVKDAYYARLVAAKLIKPTEQQLLLGDVDGDKKITAIDANIIRKFVAGVLKNLPV